MTDLDDRTLLAILGRHVGPARAQTILARARRETPAQRGVVSPQLLISRLTEGLRSTVGESLTRIAVADLGRLLTNAGPPKPFELELRLEADIARARTAAREMCQALGTSPLILQKMATIVSELARNMIAYAGGGNLSLRMCDGNRRCVHIAAHDHGAGIANLEEILAGRYKSRSGLGLGILGTKRLADRFTIESSPRGTHIEVEVSY